MLFCYRVYQALGKESRVLALEHTLINMLAFKPTVSVIVTVTKIPICLREVIFT